MVASLDLMTRTFMSSSLEMLKVNLEGSCASSASTSPLWYLHAPQVIEKIASLPK